MYAIVEKLALTRALSNNTPRNSSVSPTPCVALAPKPVRRRSLVSALSLTVANVIQAHKAPISFPFINSTGSIIAASSEKGTVNLVWNPGCGEAISVQAQNEGGAEINFNVVSSLTAVSSAHDMVHIFKLGSRKSSTSQGSSSSKRSDQPSSSPASIDRREGVQDLDSGYEAFIERKKSSSLDSSETVNASAEKPYALCRGIPSQHVHGDVGAVARLCLPPAATERAQSIVALSGTMPHVTVLFSEEYF
ncbi:hypothetical protein K443DRAFT_11295 [Laccaria amethystina LaAM-08-1]|uniref:Uncharacterized protein n=1 Tax=Laccaria amethystina LaAM-08-1 TaxID=1095629 RepID=A0A0C9WU09_9AGAR|nr:hypothetical protein K443DRAFT_11295 [Laccaria amethystina LaAM-08-1]